MDTSNRHEILERYQRHAERFDQIAARRWLRAVADDEGAPEPGTVMPLPRSPMRAELTPRELEILTLIACGYQNQEIAQRLFVAVETVKSHVRSMLARLGAKNRAHAVAVGVAAGLLDFSSPQGDLGDEL